MRTAILATVLAVIMESAPGVVAGEALIGSPDFLPSAKQPVGWRGDWTGKYPGANPPVHWGRICKQTAALKCSAAIPTNQSPADAMSAGYGFFTEWLVASPISSAHVTNAIKQELTPGEASLAPREGDKIGGTTWKRVEGDNSYVDILKMYGPMTTQQAAYAQSCLYSEKAVKIWFHFSPGPGTVFWFNGKFSTHNPDRPFVLLDLQPGWIPLFV